MNEARSRRRSDRKERVYQIAVVGNGGGGKSSLVVRFVENIFVPKYDPTIEDTYQTQIALNDTTYFVDILDTASSSDYLGLWKGYVHRMDGFLIVYSISSRSSFDAADQTYRMIREEESKASSSSGVARRRPWVLCGNKNDLEKERMVAVAEGHSLAKRWREEDRENEEKEEKAEQGGGEEVQQEQEQEAAEEQGESEDKEDEKEQEEMPLFLECSAVSGENVEQAFQAVLLRILAASPSLERKQKEKGCGLA
ncbi:Ras-related protein Rap-1A [Balamuthia mandrillaris]